MLLTRLRVWLKNVLARESLPYRMARFVYQTWLQIETRLFRGQREARPITDNSIFVLEEEMSMCSIFPKEILDLTIELFQPRTILDVGCGTGISLDYFTSKGMEVRGLEGSALAISKARHPTLIRQHDLNAPLDLGETSVVVERPNVAVSAGPLGGPPAVQFAAVFQSLEMGSSAHSALAARVLGNPRVRTNPDTIPGMNLDRNISCFEPPLKLLPFTTRQPQFHTEEGRNVVSGWDERH